MSFRSHRRWIKLFSRPLEPAGRSRLAVQLGLEGLEQRTLLSTSIPINPATWTTIGPAPIDAGEAYTGRVTAIAADPANANTIYVGEAGGGVWKTTDGGTHWLPLTDGQASPNIGAVALAPSNSNVIYAGTGEANMGPSKSTISRFNIFYGEGVLRSPDAGATWVLEGNAIFHRRSISRIVVDAQDANTVYVAVGFPSVNGLPGNTGIWKSTNGGQSWVDSTAAISTTAAFSDLAIDPSNSQVLYAAVGDPNGDPANGMWKTTDGGLIWDRAGNFPMGSDPAVGRVMVALSPNNPQIVYATVAHSGPGANLYRQMRSDDGGNTWADLTSNLTSHGLDYLLASLPTGPAGFGDYDISLAVDPSNANIVYAGGTVNGGVDLVQTTDGGATWKEISASFDFSQFLHGDEHAIAFDAQGRLIDGNDGGVWRLEDPTPSHIVWTNLNGNLGTIQVEGLALDPTNPDIAYVGAQDNGIEKFHDNLRWPFIGFGGDGGNQLVDYSNPQTVYYDAAVGSYGADFFVQRSDDAGNNFGPIVNGITAVNEPTIFYPPFVMDPGNSHRLLLGTGRVYETTDRGDDWHAISNPNVGGWTATGAITAIATAKTDGSTIYAVADAHVFVTFDDGRTWLQRDIPGYNDSSKDFFKDLVIDPNDKLVAYAVRDRFTSGLGGHVFKTTDGGQHWTDISLPQLNTTVQLPDVPTTTVRVDGRTGIVYVGNDLGVYFSSDGGTNWQVLGGGLPHVRVDKMDLATPLNILAVGTNGRGVWEIVIPSQQSGTGTLALAATSYPVNEHDGSATVTVTRTGGSDGTVSVGFETSAGSARAGVDYVATSGSLTFGPGVTSRTITVQLLDDKVGSDDRSFSVNLVAIPGGGSLGTPNAAQVTILETDFGQIQFALASPIATEISGQATIRILRVGGSDHTASVHYATADGTAKAGTDYESASGTLTFAPNQTSQTIMLPVLDDGGSGEPDETVNLKIDTPTGGDVLGSPVAAVLTLREAGSVGGGSGLPTDLVADINPGAAGSMPAGAVNVNGTLFFVADDGGTGPELWRSDGTAAGTQLVLDINPGATGSSPTDLVNVAGTLYFSANDGVHGRELWRSDGTTGGTALVRDIAPRTDTNGNARSSDPQDLTAVGSTLFFSADDGIRGRELWRSNGTTASTRLVTDLIPGPQGSDPTWLTNVSGTLFFSADSGFTGIELFKSDGTAAGTVLVRDINGVNDVVNGTHPSDLVNLGGQLYFAAFESGSGRELWRSDGTSEGTVLAKDIYPGFDPGTFLPFDSSPHGLTVMNRKLFFVATSSGTGDELWQSDGTAAGTLLVKDINPGVAGSAATSLTNVGGTLYFSAFSGALGTELWKTDGTPAGTMLVKDINPSGSSAPAGLVNVNGLLYFSANDGSHGRELWRSDGTATGTMLVQDVNLGPVGSNPTFLTPVGGVLFFQADDGLVGPELYRVNNDVPTLTVPGPQQLVAGGTLVFSTAAGTALIVADGDMGQGTVQVSLTATGGAISLASTAGLTIATGTGRGDSVTMFSGPLAAVNAALDGLTFTAMAPAAPSAGLAITVSDRGNTGFGGPQMASSVVAITVTGDGGSGGSRPLLTSATVVTAGRGASEAVFAMTAAGALYRHEGATGWQRLGGNIDSISATTEGSGAVVLLAVTKDHGLFRFSDTMGWQMLGAPGTVKSASAGTDVAGLADVFVVTTAGDFTEFRGSSGWRTSPLGGRGSVLSATAADLDRVVVVTADQSIFEFDPRLGWFRLTSSGFATSLASVADASGQLSVFAVTVNQGLFWYQASAGWQQIGAGGTVQVASAGTDSSGLADVWVTTTAGALGDYDTAFGWKASSPSGTPVGLAAAAADRVFLGLADGSVFGHDDLAGFFTLASAGFLST